MARQERGSVLLIAIFLVWQTLNSKISKAYLVLLALIYGGQLILSRASEYRVPSELVPVASLNIEGSYHCTPALMSRVSDSESYDLDARDGNKRHFFFGMFPRPGGGYVVRDWGCLYSTKGTGAVKGKLVAFGNIPASPDTPTDDEVFHRNSWQGVGADPSRELRLTDCADTINTGGETHGVAIDVSTCKTMPNQRKRVLRGLKEANRRFKTYEQINFLGQIVAASFLLALYGIFWTRIRGVDTEELSVSSKDQISTVSITTSRKFDLVVNCVKLVIAITMLYRIATFIFSDVVGGCAADDVLLIDNALLFQCRSANPLLPSMIWLVPYFIGIYAYDWLLGAKGHRVNCNEVLVHPVSVTVESAGRANWCKLLELQCSTECIAQGISGSTENLELRDANNYFVSQSNKRTLKIPPNTVVN